MATYELLNALAMLEKPDGVIGFPTDTVYGVGCLPDRPEAVERVYSLKKRDMRKPLILLGKDRKSLLPFVDCVPEKALDLMDAHWPGALTIILPKSDLVTESVTRGFDTVGIRVADCPLLNDLLALTPQGVIASTSANLSGGEPCLNAMDVRKAFFGELDFILPDDVAVVHNLASTVAAVEVDGSVHILRQGSVEID